MNWQKQIVRRTMESAGDSAALVQMLCDRAEEHPDLARHLLADLDPTGTPEPAILTK